MFPQERKYFRFRFSRVMALVLLLTSPTQAIRERDSCADVLVAWMQTPKFTSEFLMKVIQCLSGTAKSIGPDLKSILGIIGHIKKPDLESLTSGEGLLLLSAYLLYESFKLYDQAMNLDFDYKMYQEKFEELQSKLNNLKDFIDKELIPRSKQGNIADMQKIIKKFLDALNRFSEVLRELIQAILRDTKKGESDQRWSAAYTVGATAVCAASILGGNYVLLATGTCVASAGAVALNVKTYLSLRATLEKLDLLLKDTKEIRKDIAKYHNYLSNMTGEFKV